MDGYRLEIRELRQQNRKLEKRIEMLEAFHAIPPTQQVPTNANDGRVDPMGPPTALTRWIVRLVRALCAWVITIVRACRARAVEHEHHR